mmetsp:Transcript_5848/g.12812  ORF Transcript_5848/g.12812 Transcript_5848/m.12812 type:complete len:504 (+) Transcript_5848:105-1616(+)
MVNQMSRALVPIAVFIACAARIFADCGSGAAFAATSHRRSSDTRLRGGGLTGGVTSSLRHGPGPVLRQRVALAQKLEPEREEMELATDVVGAQCSIGEASACAGAGDWPLVDRANQIVEKGWGTYLLLGSAAVSMVLANLGPTRVPWTNLWNIHVGPSIGGHALSIRAWINEGLMALFFFNVGLEIKAELTEGALKSPSKALLPCFAALGGMVIPMAVYYAVNRVMPGGSMSGVTIPMATDIAFAMGVYQAFKAHMPAATGSFLLALATVDDLGAIFVIAVCFAGAIVTKYLWASLGALCIGVGQCMVGVRKSARSYFVPGVLLWYFMLRSGLCADVAGVLIALCVPMHSRNGDEVVERLINRWAPFCALVILPLFALANCAVAFGGGAAEAASSLAVPTGVFLGLLIGKPLGIFGFTMAAVKLGLGSLPSGMTKRHLGIVGMLGAIGFTMCLFLIENSLSGPAAQFSKISVFIGSVLGAVIGGVAMSRLARKSKLPASLQVA